MDVEIAKLATEVVRMAVSLYDYQREAVDKLKTGSILCGGVGSGKSRTSLAYFYEKVCNGTLDPFSEPLETKNLYIITTARKRDTKEWEIECSHFLISSNHEIGNPKISLKIDSWNNIGKYIDVENAFFIFDEQRIVGSGSWVKHFLRISKNNDWILLSATPGDVWMDYVPVFIANGFYKNRTEFIRRHVVYSRFAKYPKVERYLEVDRLKRLRSSILVNMDYRTSATKHHEDIIVGYSKDDYKQVYVDRWNIFEAKPIKDVSELCHCMRRVVNTSPERLGKLKELIENNNKVIVFYNFDYELKLIRSLCDQFKYNYKEWNGHKHEKVPESEKWVYLVQYTAGAEGWNCIETDTIIFFSQNYSYKVTHQASGRIDRLNTPFKDLYYYHFRSESPIDDAIFLCLKKKKNFNEKCFSL